jgi:uncharacterized protein YceH (UPF0502 family)
MQSACAIRGQLIPLARPAREQLPTDSRRFRFGLQGAANHLELQEARWSGPKLSHAPRERIPRNERLLARRAMSDAKRTKAVTIRVARAELEQRVTDLERRVESLEERYRS